MDGCAIEHERCTASRESGYDHVTVGSHFYLRLLTQRYQDLINAECQQRTSVFCTHEVCLSQYSVYMDRTQIRIMSALTCSFQAYFMLYIWVVGGKHLPVHGASITHCRSGRRSMVSTTVITRIMAVISLPLLSFFQDFQHNTHFVLQPHSCT